MHLWQLECCFHHFQNKMRTRASATARTPTAIARPTTAAVPTEEQAQEVAQPLAQGHVMLDHLDQTQDEQAHWKMKSKVKEWGTPYTT